MRKVIRWSLLSLIALISLTNTCFGEEKTKLDTSDLMKHAPFFGHAFNTEEFTYLGIYYPSLIYQEKTNTLSVDFEKINERSVKYRFEFDCPPLLAIKKEIRVGERVFALTQPENSSSVSLNTRYNFVGTTGEEPLFKEMGSGLKELMDADWSLQVPKPEYIPLGPDERQACMKEMLKFYFGQARRDLELYLEQVKVKMLIQETSDQMNQMTMQIQIRNKVASGYGFREKPRKDPITISFPRLVPQPNQCFAPMDVILIQFLKEQIIERDMMNLILKLPFPCDPRKIYFYIYLPTDDGSGVLQNRVLAQYELGLKEIILPSDVPQLRERT